MLYCLLFVFLLSPSLECLSLFCEMNLTIEKSDLNLKHMLFDWSPKINHFDAKLGVLSESAERNVTAETPFI